MINVTFERCKFTFNHLNNVVFEGKLSAPYWDIEPLDTEYGYCIKERRDYHIGVTDIFDNNWDFVGTIAHEMVHLYQYQVLKESPNHGKSFLVFKHKFLALEVRI